MTAPKAGAALTGILGGSFNPPHNAHVEMASRALESGEVARVAVIPSYSHPFRKELASFEHRAAMARLAFAPLGDAVEVLEIERDLGEVSYTVDTIRELARRHPGARFRLLLGTDILPDLPKWKEHEALVKMAPLLVFPRAESDGQAPESPNGIPPWSSTEIRARLAAGQDVSNMIPASVLDYIIAHRLYRTQD